MREIEKACEDKVSRGPLSSRAQASRSQISQNFGERWLEFAEHSEGRISRNSKMLAASRQLMSQRANLAAMIA